MSIRQKPKLSINQKNILRKASRNAIEDAFESLKPHFCRNRWIGKNNRYRNSCIDALDADTKPGCSVKHTDLTQYVAASAPLHCADGWGFLGRALNCHSQGNRDAARHLAYYAELRAAMSLLATEGIGIFNRRHFAIENYGNCQPCQPAGKNTHGTHDMAWLILKHWAVRKSSAELLVKIIQPGGIPLQDWLQELYIGISFGSIGNKWLKTWGLDLQRLTEDRNARNEASYRPTQMNYVTPLDVISSSDFIYNLWSINEPTNAPFEILDRYLLRLILEEGFKARTGKSVKQKPTDFEKQILLMLSRLGIRDTVELWKDFLMRKTNSEDPIVITEAQKKAKIDDPKHHLQVVSRATLLLRIATGACSQLIKKAGFGNNDLKFWWNPLGEDRGLWEPGNEPDNLKDLWADIEMAVNEIQEWKNDNKTNASYSHWQRECSLAISVLSSCERIALWGLDL